VLAAQRKERTTMKTSNAVKATLACLVAATAMRGAFEAWCWRAEKRQQIVQTIEHAEWTADAPTRSNLGDAQAHEFTYHGNAEMPRDAVELSADQAWDAGDFYDEPPDARPSNVPANFVLVRVFQRDEGDRWYFVGWIYLGADEVNALHGNRPPI
jgi:hypothetical protein